MTTAWKSGNPPVLCGERKVEECRFNCRVLRRPCPSLATFFVDFRESDYYSQDPGSITQQPDNSYIITYQSSLVTLCYFCHRLGLNHKRIVADVSCGNESDGALHWQSQIISDAEYLVLRKVKLQRVKALLPQFPTGQQHNTTPRPWISAANLLQIKLTDRGTDWQSKSVYPQHSKPLGMVSSWPHFICKRSSDEELVSRLWSSMKIGIDTANVKTGG